VCCQGHSSSERMLEYASASQGHIRKAVGMDFLARLVLVDGNVDATIVSIVSHYIGTIAYILPNL
jgi:hypothetical protein